MTQLGVATLKGTGGHAEEVVFGVMEFTQADVEGNDGSDKTEGTTSITQAVVIISYLSCLVGRWVHTFACRW